MPVSCPPTAIATDEVDIPESYIIRLLVWIWSVVFPGTNMFSPLSMKMDSSSALADLLRLKVSCISIQPPFDPTLNIAVIFWLVPPLSFYTYLIEFRMKLLTWWAFYFLLRWSFRLIVTMYLRCFLSATITLTNSHV